MSFDFSLTMRDYATRRPYSIDVSFRESEPKTRAHEIDTLVLLCANARFNEQTLRRALKDADNILHIMSIRATPGREEQLPAALAALMRRRTEWVDVGFTLFAASTPWSLAYLSLRNDAIMFGFGKYLYLNYEAYVRARFAAQCRFLYVAALMLPVATLPDDAVDQRRDNSAENARIIDFYQSFDFRAVDDPPSPGFVYTFADDLDAATGAARTVAASADTMLMRKPFMAGVAGAALPPSEPVKEGSEAEASPIAMETN